MTRFARTSATFALATLVAAAMLIGASAANAKVTPEQKCQQRRYNAAAIYAQCQQKVLGKWFGGSITDDVGKLQPALSKCRVTYTDTWAKLHAKASLTGSTCDNDRFGDNGDGTVTDRLTGLQWEQKTDDNVTVHDKDNLYSWSAGGAGFTAADGTAFTSFFATLNSGGCFAGQCDWRLPTISELQTILLEPYPCTTSPCIDQAVFGPTLAYYYWSATTDATFPNESRAAWYVNFFGALEDVWNTHKSNPFGTRAVRAGL